MPSIFTHLIVAQDALRSLPPGGLRGALEADSKAYYLGCLAPDLPYFSQFQAWRGLPLGSLLSPVTRHLEESLGAWLGWSLPQSEGWSLRLHDAGTLDLLRGWNAWSACRPGPLGAFSAGMLVHAKSDEALHPAVIELARDYGDLEGHRRHRELEISLDLVLLRSRGVALEGLELGGLLETFVGRVDQRGEHLGPALKRDWVAASQACEGEAALRRGQLDGWSRGFSAAMRLLGHPFSPMRRQQRAFLGGAEQHWRTRLARERFLAAHLPRALQQSGLALRRSPLAQALDSLPGVTALLPA